MTTPTKGTLPAWELDESLRLAMEEIQMLGKEDIPKVPEHLFVEHILPLMVNRTDEKINLGDWITLAGNPQMPINVVDGFGEILFQVPPLIRSVPTRVNENAQQSIDKVVSTAEMMYQQHPVQGHVYLNRGLRKKMPTIEPDIAAAKQWNSILKRYGYPPLGKSEQSTDSGSSGASSIFTGEDDEL